MYVSFQCQIFRGSNFACYRTSNGTEPLFDQEIISNDQRQNQNRGKASGSYKLNPVRCTSIDPIQLILKIGQISPKRILHELGELFQVKNGRTYSTRKRHSRNEDCTEEQTGQSPVWIKAKEIWATNRGGGSGGRPAIMSARASGAVVPGWCGWRTRRRWWTWSRGRRCCG